MRKASLLIVAILLFGCGDNKENERPNSPRIVKQSKVVEPKTGQKFSLGEEIPFEIKIDEDLLDSIVVQVNDARSTFTTNNFQLPIQTEKVGSHRIKTTVFFGDKKENHSTRIVYLSPEAPEEYTYTVANTLSHGTDEYTQGLLITGGFLYESTGRNGSSTLKKKVINTGEIVNQINLSDDFFGEGLAILNDQFYQLTYTSGACFVYNRDLERVNSFNYQGEGWGLCAYGDKLLMTNGSEKIFVRDPNSFSVLNEIEVYDDKGKVEYLNELEMIDGLIYANVYQEDFIVAIEPETGTVKKRIDLSNLLSEGELRNVDVLNGIAYDESTKKIYVTGKLWPKLFEVKFVPKKPI